MQIRYLAQGEWVEYRRLVSKPNAFKCLAGWRRSRCAASWCVASRVRAQVSTQRGFCSMLMCFCFCFFTSTEDLFSSYFKQFLECLSTLIDLGWPLQCEMDGHRALPG